MGASGKLTTIADMWAIGRELQQFRSNGASDYSDVISKLEKELTIQKAELKTKINTEITILKELICMMEECLGHI